MNFLFNEQSAIEKMIQIKVVEDDNIFITVRDLARYNYFVCKMSNDDNYKSILKYLQNNGQNVNEENVYKIIDDCVKKAKKYQFQQVDKVCITQSEMDFIAQLGDIKKEKIAFVLLASAKYYDAVRGVQKHTAYMGNSDICKLARVTIPAKERNVFMQFAYDNGILSRHSRAASTEKKVLFVSQDNNDKIVLRLEESDFKDLAYTYLAYKTPHKFRRCVVCRRWIRIDSNNRRLCKECVGKGNEEKNTIKEVQCIDCGKPVYVSELNSKSIRCPDCQYKFDNPKMEIKIVVCDDCGKEFEVNAKDNQTRLCVSCYKKHRHNNKLISQGIRRETQKLLQHYDFDLTYIINTYRDLNSNHTINIDKFDALCFAVIVLNSDKNSDFDICNFLNHNLWFKNNQNIFLQVCDKLCKVGLIDKNNHVYHINKHIIDNIKSAELKFYQDCYIAAVTPAIWKKQVENRLRMKSAQFDQP